MTITTGGPKAMRTAPQGAQLADRLEAAGLTGRGGAAFSTATKLRSTLTHSFDLIVNACDGEIGAVKDAWIVANRLGEVERGAALLGARSVRWAAHRDSGTHATLVAARLDVLPVPHRYVSSEESALVSLAHGGLARPLTKHVPVSIGGVDGRGKRMRPTLVLNAETVWRIAQVVEQGPAWFRSHGTAAEPGPRLVAIGGAVTSPGVLETAAGVPVRDLVAAAGGTTGRMLGVGIGGLSGGWLTPQEADRANWSRDGLSGFHIGPGAGVVHVLGADRCPLDHVADTLSWAAGESAGQCGPCMFGLPAVANDMALLAEGRAGHEVMSRLRGRLGLLPGRGACRFPDGVASYAASALRAFAPEVDLHRRGTCGHLAPGSRRRSS